MRHRNIRRFTLEAMATLGATALLTVQAFAQSMPSVDKNAPVPELSVTESLSPTIAFQKSAQEVLRTLGRSDLLRKERAREAPATPLPVNLSALLEIDLGSLPEGIGEEAEQDSNPRQIGVHRAVPQEYQGDLTGELTWEEIGDERVAGLAIRSDGAESVRVEIAVRLPEGSRISVIGDGASHEVQLSTVQGGESVPESAWLPSVRGDTATITIRIPGQTNLEDVSLEVTRVAHRWEAAAGLQSTSVTTKHGGTDFPTCIGKWIPSCETTNPEALTAQRSSAHYHFESRAGTFICSGTLISTGETNRRQGRDYFLTANHCVSTTREAASMEIVWFWQTSTCAQGRSPWLQRGGARFVETSSVFDTTLLLLNTPAPTGTVLSGWSARAEDAATYSEVYALHHPRGTLQSYAEGFIAGNGNTYVGGELRINAINTLWSRGITEPGSSGSGLFTGEYLVGVLSGGRPTELQCHKALTHSIYGSFADFYPFIAKIIDPAAQASPPLYSYDIPFMLRQTPSRQGFVRVSNLSDTDGDIHITALDRNGRKHEVARVHLNVLEVFSFNSDDLENGDSLKGIQRGIGEPPGGNWRVRIETGLQLAVNAYVRTNDGFVTDVSRRAENLAEGESYVYYVPFVNPASNQSVRSTLQATNLGSSRATIAVVALDDAGSLHVGGVYGLDSQTTDGIDSIQLEEQAGDGHGKWRLVVVSDQPLNLISLLDTASGHISNVSQAPVESIRYYK